MAVLAWRRLPSKFELPAMCTALSQWLRLVQGSVQGDTYGITPGQSTMHGHGHGVPVEGSLRERMTRKEASKEKQ